MSFSPITHIRHFDIAVPDFDKQIEFYKNHWGLTVQHDDGDVVYFAAEGSPEQYVTRVRRSADKRLDLVAFGAADRESVDELASNLASSGVKLVFEPTDLQTLGGGYGFRFFDLEGRTIEVSTDVETRTHRKIEERESIPVRLSHVVLNSAEPEYMRGSGRIIRAGYRKIWGPGRHRAGDNTFTYFIDPNGNTMEMTTELETIDEDSWHPHIFDVQEPETSDQWGTGGDMDEFITKEMFNDSDEDHLFVAPPV